MKNLLRLIAFGVLFTLSACNLSSHGMLESTMPRAGKADVGPKVHDAQGLLASTRHWNLVADDVADGLCGSEGVCAFAPTDPCLTVAFTATGGSETPFERVFPPALIQSLLNKHASVYELGASPCDRVTISAAVVRLTGAQRTPYYAGDYTVLAEGLVVVRNVARAASAASIVGTVALGEAAYWLSPNYLTRHPMAEVAVTVSRISLDGRYKSQYRNVYYIDARDIDAYWSAEQPEEPRGTTQQQEVGLPPIAASPSSKTKGPFTAKTPFGIAGGKSSHLVAASTDGSEVVGNVTFFDSHSHVVLLDSTGKHLDLGTMNGATAEVTSMSADGTVVVGRVRDGDGSSWSVFKCKVSTDGCGAVENLGRGRYVRGSVASALVSADGSTLVVNIDAQQADRSVAGRVVRFGQSLVNDSFNIAFAKQFDSGRASCTAIGVSSDGHDIEVFCGTAGVFLFSDGKVSELQNLSQPLDAPVQGPFVMSDNLKFIVGTVAGNAVVASLDGNADRRLLPGFKPAGLSGDGKVVFGTASDQSAAVWYLTSKNSASVYSAPSNCRATAAGYFQHGNLLLINVAPTDGHCCPEDAARAQDAACAGEMAWVLAH